MDFGSGSVGLRDGEAKLYRTKLLEAQKKPMAKKTGSKMSEDLKQKKMKQDAGGHGHGAVDTSEKASFGQCIFNMANILMVSILHSS